MNHSTIVDAILKQHRRILDDASTATPWTGSTDVTALTTSTSHREGSVSLSFAKSGTTQAYGQISKTLTSAQTIDIVDFFDGKLRYWINLSDITHVTSVQLVIGEDASNNYVYTTLVASLTTGWQSILKTLSSPDTTNGTGAAWSSINYIAVIVNFDGASRTLTNILVDAISVFTETTISIESATIDGAGLATSAKQDTGNTSLSSIDTKLSSQATAANQTTANTSLASIATNTAAKGTIGHGNKTVATAGTDVVLAGSTPCTKVIIEAYALNTGRIAVGASGVDATEATGNGITLGPRDSVTLHVSNLSLVYIDSTISGDGVRYTYLNN